VFASNPEQVGALVTEWLAPDNLTLAVMAARSSALARPDATEQIVAAALNLMQPAEVL
jgi:UDP-N-acetylglucosamine:LPS N-acetylglucosamine transferase